MGKEDEADLQCVPRSERGRKQDVFPKKRTRRTMWKYITCEKFFFFLAVNTFELLKFIWCTNMSTEQKALSFVTDNCTARD